MSNEEFNGAALTLEAYQAQKQELAAELSAIIGFDVNLLKKIDSDSIKGYSFAHHETTFSQALSGAHTAIGFSIQTKGLASWIFSSVILNPAIFAYKKDDQWHLTTSRYNDGEVAAPEKIREAFNTRLVQIGVDIADYLKPDVQPAGHTPKPEQP